LRAEEAFRLRFAIFRTFRGRGRLWLDCAPAKFDWSTLIANKDKEIARLEAIYQNGVQKAGGTTFASRATLVDAHTIRLEAEDRTVTADQILIATGGRPPGILRCRATNTASSSNEAFYLERLPAAILIEGGGYIAVEFANIFHGLGVDVTLVYGAEILSRFDHDLRGSCMKRWRRRASTFSARPCRARW
jgi:glutathione reductase (NADPH)